MSEDGTPKTLPGELAFQISRVTKIREQYKQASKHAGPSADFRPAILMMKLSIQAGIDAVGSTDIERQVLALRDLRGYRE